MATEDFTPGVEELVSNNAGYAAAFDGADLDVAPARRLAVVACMDARMDPYRMLGLKNGDAHILRNGGGVVTDDVIRSLCLSQRLLGTREIVLVHHTRCGLQTVDEAAFKAELEADLGVKPAWAVEGFADPHADVRQSIRRLVATPFLPHKDHISGFVYDVDDGRLLPVEAGDSAGSRG